MAWTTEQWANAFIKEIRRGDYDAYLAQFIDAIAYRGNLIGAPAATPTPSTPAPVANANAGLNLIPDVLMQQKDFQDALAVSKGYVDGSRVPQIGDCYLTVRGKTVTLVEVKALGRDPQLIAQRAWVPAEFRAQVEAAANQAQAATPAPGVPVPAASAPTLHNGEVVKPGVLNYQHGSTLLSPTPTWHNPYVRISAPGRPFDGMIVFVTKRNPKKFRGVCVYPPYSRYFNREVNASYAMIDSNPNGTNTPAATPAPTPVVFPQVDDGFGAARKLLAEENAAMAKGRAAAVQSGLMDERTANEVFADVIPKAATPVPQDTRGLVPRKRPANDRKVRRG
jgi:hypothetical protein